ncbi:hypothetical protein Pla110_44480 [Polystyrenella longa]|uniref:Uncharacterized protein n=1 Tax=Polystyrenella longa TaxID=2528007 RepID=A0A518CTX8_9PLAN|nr:hypothetical protein [Polystyrenella longa]QDU82687.1 hypothetical protein Pla110_44480 [Polystyrenella longa]
MVGFSWPCGCCGESTVEMLVVGHSRAEIFTVATEEDESVSLGTGNVTRLNPSYPFQRLWTYNLGYWNETSYWKVPRSIQFDTYGNVYIGWYVPMKASVVSNIESKRDSTYHQYGAGGTIGGVIKLSRAGVYQWEIDFGKPWFYDNGKTDAENYKEVTAEQWDGAGVCRGPSDLMYWFGTMNENGNSLFQFDVDGVTTKAYSQSELFDMSVRPYYAELDDPAYMPTYTSLSAVSLQVDGDGYLWLETDKQQFTSRSEPDGTLDYLYHETYEDFRVTEGGGFTDRDSMTLNWYTYNKMMQADHGIHVSQSTGYNRFGDGLPIIFNHHALVNSTSNAWFDPSADVGSYSWNTPTYIKMNDVHYHMYKPSGIFQSANPEWTEPFPYAWISSGHPDHEPQHTYENYYWPEDESGPLPAYWYHPGASESTFGNPYVRYYNPDGHALSDDFGFVYPVSNGWSFSREHCGYIDHNNTLYLFSRKTSYRLPLGNLAIASGELGQTSIFNIHTRTLENDDHELGWSPDNRCVTLTTTNDYLFVGTAYAVTTSDYYRPPGDPDRDGGINPTTIVADSTFNLIVLDRYDPNSLIARLQLGSVSNASYVSKTGTEDTGTILYCMKGYRALDGEPE